MSALVYVSEDPVERHPQMVQLREKYNKCQELKIAEEANLEAATTDDQYRRISGRINALILQSAHALLAMEELRKELYNQSNR